MQPCKCMVCKRLPGRAAINTAGMVSSHDMMQHSGALTWRAECLEVCSDSPVLG